LSAGKYPKELQADYSMELDLSKFGDHEVPTTLLEIIGPGALNCNCPQRDFRKCTSICNKAMQKYGSMYIAKTL
jgi:hypothetical protein